MKKGCENCIKCVSILRKEERCVCREWTAPKGLAVENLLITSLKDSGCSRWKPLR